MKTFDIYDPVASDTLRFQLGESGSNRVIVLGLNPAKATRDYSDNTITRVRTAARERGRFDGFVMLNLCPLRETHHTRLPDVIDKSEFRKNLEVVDRHLSTIQKPRIWAAWGDAIFDRRYFVESLLQIVDIAADRGTSWIRFGALTQRGHPRHPSRLSYSWDFEDFDMASYARRLEMRISGEQR